jgi:hypothetical protein
MHFNILHWPSFFQKGSTRWLIHGHDHWDLRFLGPQGFDGPHGLLLFFFVGPHGFFCSAAVLFPEPASAGCAMGAPANPDSNTARATTDDFLDIEFPFVD